MVPSISGTHFGRVSKSFNTHWPTQQEAGGNEALPPRWDQSIGEGNKIVYQDHNLGMTSWRRPLPGVRLGELRGTTRSEELTASIDTTGQLIPGCEWYISPLGRSYFTNSNNWTTSWEKPTAEPPLGSFRNNQTTSWEKPIAEPPLGSLTPDCIVEGHSELIWSLAGVGTNCNIMSASLDGSIRQWRRNGEPVGKPWRSDGIGVRSLAVSPDDTMVVSGSECGRLRLWNMKEGSIVGDPWEGHNDAVRCLDWSRNAQEILSGSRDDTIRRWNPDTGCEIAPPIETGHGYVHVVKYSPQDGKFASGGADNIIRVWSRDSKLLIEIRGHEYYVMSLCWSKDGAHIFSGARDMTVRKWQSDNAKELVVLRGHTNTVTSICLSQDERHLISASMDCSVRMWNLETNLQVGEPLVHNDELLALAISSDGQYISTAGLDKKLYLWCIGVVLRRGGDQLSVRALLLLKCFLTGLAWW
jgi:WD40 repeat protein